MIDSTIKLIYFSFTNIETNFNQIIWYRLFFFEVGDLDLVYSSVGNMALLMVWNIKMVLFYLKRSTMEGIFTMGKEAYLKCFYLPIVGHLRCVMSKNWVCGMKIWVIRTQSTDREFYSFWHQVSSGEDWNVRNKWFYISATN